MTKQLTIKIFGIVQGVTLRTRISVFAKMLGLKGYISNLDDGSVEILAQGRETALEELLIWCQKTPFPAKLTGMSYEWSDQIAHSYKDFNLKLETSFIKDKAESLLKLSKEVLHYKQQKISAPQHVVIIPDGNRRWAKERGWFAWVGHRKAVEYERVRNLFNECKEIGVKYLTFWAFSTENWKRDQKEVEEIFNVMRKSVKSFKNEFIKEQIRFRHMGRRDRLPQDIIAIVDDLEQTTKDYDKLHFQLCLDYNGRDDIVRAIQKMVKENDINSITEELVSKYLDSNGIPDPDLIIRTSGERRTSGIMAYQAAYAELYFTNVYFPDFDADQFRRAILDYSARIRRFGGSMKEQLAQELVDPDEKTSHTRNLALN